MLSMASSLEGALEELPGIEVVATGETEQGVEKRCRRCKVLI
jgi:hypothetical protein